jgi:hypothetical protein
VETAKQIIILFDHPGYPDTDDNTPREVTKIIGMVSAMELASTVMRRLLGQQGALYDEIMQFPKVAFLDAVACLLDGHYLINIDAVEMIFGGSVGCTNTSPDLTCGNSSSQRT